MYENYGSLLKDLAKAMGWDPTHLTIGEDISYGNAASLESTRVHERVHVRQCEAWGPLFVPAYLAASIVAAARGGNFYYDNRFEAEAYAGRGTKDLGQARFLPARE